jgi:hypothetical protein
VLRENLAELLEAEEEWTQAAQTLAGIDLDSGGGPGWGVRGGEAGGRTARAAAPCGSLGLERACWAPLRPSPPPWTPGVRNVDPSYRLRQNVRIAMLYLEDDDPISAEQVPGGGGGVTACIGADWGCAGSPPRLHLEDDGPISAEQVGGRWRGAWKGRL